MSKVTLTESIFGKIFDKSGNEKPVKQFTWKNLNNVSVQVITYGATITSIKLPDKNGKIDDIVTGYNEIEGYQKPVNRFFGATIGRSANRIKEGKCKIANNEIFLSTNRDIHHLHGGFNGFDKVLWESHVDGNKLILSYYSRDLEEGYPGDVVVNVSFELTSDNAFLIQYKVNTTKSTIVNMTNHSYFNLAGESAGAHELYKHKICINADSYTEVDKNGIPTGNVLPVVDTVFDLRIPTVLENVIHKVPGSEGFDHNFCINKTPEHGVTFISRAIHEESGRVMEIYSDQPGVQFYTANFLPENPKMYKGNPKDLITIIGKQGNYYKHAGFCMETQNWPDAPNHKNFPNSILHPGATYVHKVSYKFSVKN